MHSPHRIAPLVAAAAALSSITGCGHRAAFAEASEAAFKGNNAGSAVSTAGNPTTATGSTSSTTGGGPACGEGPLELVINGHDMLPGYDEPADPLVETLLGQMTLDQKITQMQGVPKTDPPMYTDIERSPDAMGVAGYDLRGYRYRDAGRGVNLDAGQDNRPHDDKNYATAFPAPSLRAASWDLDLEWRVGFAMGDETAASKNNMLLAPCMNIIRHPFWGRTQETYGEDSFHIGRMASAFTAGLQQVVVGCAKHFAANNVEENRMNQDAVMSEQTLREIYGRHFEMVIRDGGVGCIMASYNKINQVKSTQNPHLLTTILRDPYESGGMGYRGLVISDWWAMPGNQGPIEPATALAQAAVAAAAGLDIEVPWTLNYGQLSAAVAAGELDQRYIDASARRILEQKFRFKTAFMTDDWGLVPSTTRLEGSSIVGNEPHLDLAEEAVIKSAVLLHNGASGAPVLPLAAPASIAVIGAELAFSLEESLPPTSSDGVMRFATAVALGDRGSSRVNADPAKSVGPFDGIQGLASGRGVGMVTTGTTAAAAEGAEVVVVVVGLTPADEGEEYAITNIADRQTLDLPAGQNQLVADVLALNKPTIVVVESGSIVNVPWLSHANQNQATIWLGYPGQRAGLALAKLLFGEANFSGKMPMAWPAEADLPPFQTEENKTDMGYFFGYREYDRRAAAGTPANLVFPFGHGLSYTSYSYAALEVPCTDISEKGVFDVTVEITNSGAVDGEEVALLFISGPPKPEGTMGERNVKELKSFAKVAVAAGSTVTATLPVRVQDLRHWEGDETGHWVIDPGEYTIMVGPNASDAALALRETITIHP